MHFEWDEAKNELNIRKHGFDFADADRVFHGPFPFLIRIDCREDYGEDRWMGIGMLDGRVVVLIVFTEPATNIIRIISMRKATNHERAAYEKAIKN